MSIQPSFNKVVIQIQKICIKTLNICVQIWKQFYILKAVIWNLHLDLEDLHVQILKGQHSEVHECQSQGIKSKLGI